MGRNRIAGREAMYPKPKATTTAITKVIKKIISAPRGSLAIRALVSDMIKALSLIKSTSGPPRSYYHIPTRPDTAPAT